MHKHHQEHLGAASVNWTPLSRCSWILLHNVMWGQTVSRLTISKTLNLSVRLEVLKKKNTLFEAPVLKSPSKQSCGFSEMSLCGNCSVWTTAWKRQFKDRSLLIIASGNKIIIRCSLEGLETAAYLKQGGNEPKVKEVLITNRISVATVLRTSFRNLAEITLRRQ